MKVVSLFDGISCGMVALQRAGISPSRYVAYEIDKYATQVSQTNYPHIEHCGSVVNADFSQYKGFDIVMGGFPCTDLSIATKNRQGLAGARSRLFWELVRAINEIQPRFFLVENNASMPAADKAIITAALGVEPVLINSALVSGQQRKRLYWTNIPNITQPADKGILLADVLESGLPYTDKVHALTSTYAGAVFWNSLTRHQRRMVAEPVRLGHYGVGAQAQRIYSVKGKSVCLSANGGGAGAKTGLYKVDLPAGDYIIRKLTPIECERLQTLPDNYTAGISNTQRYKCLGNGWTVGVIAHILKYINQ